MSKLVINHKCIACDACREVCPTQAINVGDPTYNINQDICILCVGYADNPNCMTVCPIDAILFEKVDSKILA
ncbi:ferredoxin [Helicobacter didelphidarum]|uniref:Ferredoxin n=1 Tax=Helicobacter didelphidarum TaxID=2040648 RepID=A0A3D8IJ23_9HELI|nr:4Fe-4S binding protein [Helicobacter didelphidarum]RDU65327.1 ferredoxin [Helicobacter didelphidarum]